jgi:hypothetical protein
MIPQLNKCEIRIILNDLKRVAVNVKLTKKKLILYNF